MKNTPKRSPLQAIKIFVRQIKERRDPAQVYVLAMTLCTGITLIAALCTGFEAARNLFYVRGNDCFMDFFNSMRDLLGGGAVYTQRGVIYPPMANLIFLVFSKFMPTEYLATSFDDRYAWSAYPAAWVVCFVYLVLIGLAFLLITGKFYPKKWRYALAFFSVFNFSVLSGLERGNVALLSVAALFFYVLSYDSRRPLVREMGLIALAFSTSLKMYPIVFAWFLLTDKRFKEAARLFLYTVLLFLLPSFFFGGPRCFVWIVQNILAFSTGRMGATPGYLWFQNGAFALPYYGLLALGVVCFVVFSFAGQKRWKLLVHGCALLLMFPPLRASYAWAVLLAPLALFFKEEKLESKTNIAYFVIMAFPFLLTPIMLLGVNLSELGVVYGAVLLLLLCITDGCRLLLQKKTV